METFFNRSFRCLCLVLLSLIIIAGVSCSSGSGETTTEGRGSEDDDDDVDIPDDDIDDDISDDDAADDSADDATDDATDDSTDDATDDSADDTGDDTSCDDPVITITEPIGGHTYSTHEINVDAHVENAVWGGINCYYDSENITSLLTIADAGKGYNFNITGVIDGVPSGSHMFRIVASNDCGGSFKSASFDVLINDPYLELTLSQYLAQPEESVTASVTVYDEDGVPVSASHSYSVSPSTGFTRTGDSFVFHQTGQYEITASAAYGGKVLLSDTETIQVKDLVPDHVAVVLSAATTQAGVPITANATVYNQFDEPLDGFQVVFTVSPSIGVTVSGHVITMTKTGVHHVTGTVQGTSVSQTKDCTVTPGTPTSVDLSLSRSTIVSGQSITWSATVKDRYGNIIPDAAATVSVTPTTGVTVSGDTITFARASTTPFTVRAQYTFLYDTATVQVNDGTEPRIVWSSPERGYVTLSTGVTLTGQVIENESSVAVFTINGDDVSLDTSGHFNYMLAPLVYGLNIIEAYAEDEFGNSTGANLSVLRGNLLADDAVCEDIVGVRINESGLNEIENIAVQFIADFDVASLLNPYLPFVVGSPGDTAYVVGDMTNFAYGAPVIDLSPQWGGLGLTATIPSIDIDAYIDVSLMGGAATRYTVDITGSISATADVDLSVSGGVLSVSVDNFLLNMSGLSIVINGYSNPSVVTLIQSIVNTMVTSLLQEELPQLIEDLLSELDLTFAQEILGVNYNFSLEFASIDFDTEGGTIWMDGQVTTDTVDPGTRDIGGSLMSPGTPPTMGVYSPGHMLYGFGVAVGDEFLNQALYQFYRSGLLSLHINNEWAQDHGFDWDLTTTDLALFLPGLSDLYPNAPIEFWLNPQLPPVIVYAPEETDSLDVELQIGDLLLNLMVVPEGEDPVDALGVSLAVKVPLTIGLNTETQSLSVAFGTPVTSVDVYESEFLWFPYGLIEQLMPMVVDLALPLLSSFIDEIPIPAFEGFTLELAEMSVFGSYDDFLGIFGDLAQVE